MLCAAIQESGLLLFTYGDANNEECNVDIQLAHKVRGAIYSTRSQCKEGMHSSPTR